jgi:hypothetical protein
MMPRRQSWIEMAQHLIGIAGPHTASAHDTTTIGSDVRTAPNIAGAWNQDTEDHHESAAVKSFALGLVGNIILEKFIWVRGSWQRHTFSPMCRLSTLHKMAR